MLSMSEAFDMELSETLVFQSTNRADDLVRDDSTVRFRRCLSVPVLNQPPSVTGRLYELFFCHSHGL